MSAFRTTTLGYLRITPDRRYKTALEAFWAGTIDEAALGTPNGLRRRGAAVRAAVRAAGPRRRRSIIIKRR